MRVLLFSAAEKSHGAGVQRVMSGLADYLGERGHRVVTAWPDGEGTEDDWHLDLEIAAGASGWPRPGALLRAGGGMSALAARLARFRPDVVNLHYPRGQSLYFDLLRRAFGYRLVLSFHNTDFFGASEAVRNYLPRWVEEADGVTAVSSDLQRGLAGIAPESRPVLIANGVDTDFWSPAEAGGRDPRLVVAAGRLVPMKGFDLLLPAFARIASRDDRLVIAGEGEDRGALEAMARELGIEDRVDFPGHVSGADLRALFRRAGLFVLPSRREGMPLVLLEAMATGLPAVAAKVSGVPQVMRPDCGETVPPEDVEALAAAMGRRLGRASCLDAEGTAARSRVVEEFRVAKTYAAYEAVLAGR